MSFSPSFSFFLADIRTPLYPGDPGWHQWLPLTRQDLAGVGSSESRSGRIRYGDYFTAAADFLCSDQCAPLAAAAAALAGKPVAPNDIVEIRIFLEKHGPFYHPSRVQVLSGGNTASLVLNVAVSAAGRRGLEPEVKFIEALGNRKRRWVPRLFRSGFGRSADGRSIPMFLAEWFEGFCEFHLAGTGDSITVWDPGAGARLLSVSQRRDLYRGVARILADTYSIENGGRVHPWHHAAGDFVLRTEGDRTDLRLISVRGYPSPIPGPGAEPEDRLRELLVFFLHSSIRTRIDRRDGTGELLWADAASVEPTLIGFAEALAEKPPISGWREPTAGLFLGVLGALSSDALASLASEAVDDFDPDAAEAAFARKRLVDHLQDLRAALDGLTLPETSAPSA